MSFNRNRGIFTCEPKCEGRKPGCHSTCEKYLRERKQQDELNRAERLRKEAELYTVDIVASRKNKNAIRRRAKIQGNWYVGG
jgi:hypothetical protein